MRGARRENRKMLGVIVADTIAVVVDTHANAKLMLIVYTNVMRVAV